MANEEVESSGEDYDGVIEKAASKKKALTTTKMQKEAAERRECIKTEGKYLYTLLERHCCL